MSLLLVGKRKNGKSICARLERPCSPPGDGHQIQAGQPADDNGKAELHTGEHLISKIRRESTTRSAIILSPPGGTVPSRVIWDLPNRHTLQTQRSQQKGPTRLDLMGNQTLHTPRLEHLVSNMLPSMRCHTSTEITWLHKHTMVSTHRVHHRTLHPTRQRQQIGTHTSSSDIG